MAAIIAFGVSFVALVLFLAFKLFEKSHKITAYASLRKKGDALVVSTAMRLNSRIKNIEKHFSVRSVAELFMHHTATAIARTARSVEMSAQNVTRKMARNGNGEIPATKSKFLEEVSTHKKNLDTERIRRETSLTRLHEDANGQAEENEDRQ
ncbi:MAG: hypothetical protein JKX80_01085 [Candidatus Pacebacteria bacterium]|nr:hypothetical protein [Candidatus Paceibacterota bacterium]